MSVRRIGRAVVALSLATAALAVTAPVAHAATAPWRFDSLFYVETSLAAGATDSRSATCDLGYSLVGGGFRTNSPEIEVVGQYRDAGNPNTLVFRIHNYASGPTSVALYPICAWSSDVGTIQKVTAKANPSGWYAGGQARCPTGWRALFGGADWDGGGPNRRIDISGPSTDGGGWAVSGENPGTDAFQLSIEAYCVAASSLGAYSTPRISTQDSGAGAFSRVTECPAGTRVVSGGVLAGPVGGAPDLTAYRADIYRSAPPSGALSWEVAGKTDGARLTYTTWCIPASQPVANITSGPQPVTNQTTATFTHVKSDPKGEDTSHSCLLDTVPRSCDSDGTTEVSGLGPGQHTFVYRVRNSSWQEHAESVTWTVDLTAPTVNVPVAPLAGPLVLTFSEKVAGVNSSSIQVRVAGQATPLSGQVTLDAAQTHASWTPTAPLVPGESYAVTTTDAIHDLAGNALVSPPQEIHAAVMTETSLAQFTRTWDPDTSSLASGGGYASSRTPGSSATWTFTATSGKRATVYGVRQPLGGYAHVYVDGVRQARVSFHASSVRHKVPLFTSAALAGGTHRVEVRPLGTKPAASSGTWVGLDYLRVGTTNRQETAAVKKFRRVSTASASAGSYDTVPHRISGDTGGTPAYTLVFRGSGVQLYATRTAGSGSARIYVDGILKQTVNLRSPATAYQALVATISELPDVRHTLRVVPVGTSSGTGSDLGLDRVDVIRTFG